MNPSPERSRPFSVTLIALFQWGLAAYLFFFAVGACIDPPGQIDALRYALRLLMGRTDRLPAVYATPGQMKVDLIFMIAMAGAISAYGSVTGWGLWRLKAWARHSVGGEYGVGALLWAKSLFLFGATGGFSRVPGDRLEPVYMVVFVLAVISLKLLFSGGMAEAFGEKE